uniref:Cytochrome b561 domain-containing protein n=1 Tax=Plectus sambesii TaxID=2011161 RepID=A0A914UIG3_9BILA
MASTDYYSETGSLIKGIDEKEEPRQLRSFSFFIALSQIFGFLMIFLTGYWNDTWQGGYEWGPNKEGILPNGTHYPIPVKGNWHYHSTFMTYGMVFLQGEAILMYRLFRHERKIFSKFLHGLFHLFTVIFIIFGLIAVVQNKNNEGDNHMFSAHSWFGVTVMTAFVLQYIAGFVSFGFPKVSPSVRAWYLPIHRAIGLLIFGGSCAQVLMGYMEQTWIVYAFYSKYIFGNCYNTLDCHGEAFVLNFNILALIFYAMTVLYLTINKKYIRQKTIDEEQH